MYIKEFSSFNQIRQITLSGGLQGHSSQTYAVLNTVADILYKIHRRSKLKILCVFEDNKIICCAPFRVKGNLWSVLGGTEAFDYCDFIYFEEQIDVCEKAFKKIIEYMKTVHFCEKLDWRYLDEKSISACFIENSDIIKVLQKEKFENAIIRKNYDNYEDYFNRLSKHIRQNLRTAYNRISKAGYTVELSVYSQKSGSIKTKTGKQLLKECINIYIKRQAEQYGHKGRYWDIKYRCTNYVSRSVNCEEFVLIVLQINNNAAAFMEGYYNPRLNVIEIPRLAINSEFSFFSPGVLLVNETMKYIYKNNISALDLCRGTERYKTDLGGDIYLTKSYICGL